MGVKIIYMQKFTNYTLIHKIGQIFVFEIFKVNDLNQLSQKEIKWYKLFIHNKMIDICII